MNLAPKPLLWTGLACAGIIALPILSLLVYLFIPASVIRAHLFETVLNEYLINSLILSAGTALTTLVIGVSTAWFCSTYRFAGRNFYEWALILPFAYPAYIVGYVYTGMLDYGGSIYTWLQHTMGLQAPIPIRSMGGAIAVISLALYPYVYLLARSAWLEKSYRLLEAGRILGASPRRNFISVALPVARPAIVAGVAIVMMETLADYGTVQYFGVNTFSVGILRTWTGLDSIAGATQLSIILLLFTVGIMFVEKRARRRAQYTASDNYRVPELRLRGGRAVIANVVCAAPIVLGFVLPAVQLAVWTVRRAEHVVWSDYWALISNTFSVAIAGAFITAIIALLIAYIKRLYPAAKSKVLMEIAASGYAVPGVVIAVGILTLISFTQALSGVFIGGSVLVLVLAYCTRFMTLGVKTMDAAIEKVSPNLNFSSRSLGASESKTLIKVYLPLLKSGLLTALLLVFVDIVKELPMTSTLRPFDFNTLSVRAFEMASDERISDAALPALSIALISLLPIILLIKSMRKQHQ